MPRVCSICSHGARNSIDAAIVAGTPNRRIATQHGLSEAAVRRHAESHVPVRLAVASQAAAVTSADDLLAEVRRREQRADDLGRQAEASGDIRTALQALREWRGLAELRARLAGELDERAVVVLTQAPEWVSVRSAILDALAPYPEARLHVAAALQHLDGAP